MKNILLVWFSLLVTSISLANMASPIEPGSTGFSPFISKYVSIFHENIDIKIDKDFEQASYHVTYHINASKNGVQIPFLFHASEYKNAFKVKIDHKIIPLQKLPEYFNELDDTNISGFDYFFNENTSLIEVKESMKNEFNVYREDLLYFKTNIDSGKHVIEVTYHASPWINKDKWVNRYSFRYSLAPAKYWKSFNKLTVNIHAKDFPFPLTTNLDSATIKNNITTYTFHNIPKDYITINFNPKTTGIAHFLIKLTPFGIALIIGIILFIMNILWIRKKASKKWSTPMITGLVFVPIIFTFVWIIAYPLIDNIIGKHASDFHGYATIMILLTLPVSYIIYWMLLVIVKNTRK